jgi:hypothetical protein
MSDYRVTKIIGTDASVALAGVPPPAPGAAINPAAYDGYQVFLGGDVGLVYSHTTGMLYMSISAKHVVLQIDPRTNEVIAAVGTWGSSGYSGDGGQGTAAMLNTPGAICLSDDGLLYIADYGNNVVRKWNPSTGVISATSLPAGAYRGIDMTTESDLVVLSTYSTITRVLSGQASTVNTTTDGGQYVALMSDGNVFIGRAGTNLLSKYNARGTVPQFHTWYNYGATIDNVAGVYRSLDRAKLYAMFVTNNNTIYQVDLSTYALTPVTSIASPNSAINSPFPSVSSDADGFSLSSQSMPTCYSFQSASGMIIDPVGTIWFANSVYLWKAVRVIESPLAPTTGHTILGVLETGILGFTDENAVSMLRSNLTINEGVAAAQSYGADIAAYIDHLPSSYPSITPAGSFKVLMGSSFSNAIVNELETSVPLWRSVCSTLSGGVFSVDTQNRGLLGDGTAYGSNAPRIQVVNKNGTFLVERWLNVNTVHDYAYVIFIDYPKSGNTHGSMLLLCGIRDIATKAAAYAFLVAPPQFNISISPYAAFAGNNAFLVCVTYPVTITTPAAFSPMGNNPNSIPVNTQVIPLSAVNSIHPVVS